MDSVLEGYNGEFAVFIIIILKVIVTMLFYIIYYKITQILRTLLLVKNLCTIVLVKSRFCPDMAPLRSITHKDEELNFNSFGLSDG